MKIKLSTTGILLALTLIAASPPLFAAGQPRGGGHSGSRGAGGGYHGGGGPRGGGGYHGGGGYRGGGYRGGGYRGGGLGWWGLGLGLGLGWDGVYGGYPYGYYPSPADGDPGYYYPDNAPAVVGPSAPGPSTNWYYCASAGDYYPRVPQCPEQWRLVPGAPPGTER